jgi:tRNA threonylcarbamoyladenosine biosynthesis protein TsaE
MDLESQVTKSEKYFKMTKEYQISSLEGLSQVSECLIQMSREANVIAFYGAMGAGKTTLIKNLCHKLGVADEVNSPTFAIVNEYLDQEQNSIYHFDFYRIKKIEEAYDIGYENYFYSDSLCLIEWPEMIEPLLPDKYIRVDISLGETDDSRVIKCSVSE